MTYKPPYKIDLEIKNLINELSLLINKDITNLKSDPAESVYATCAIEGNKLSMQDVANLIKHQSNPYNKEEQEIINAYLIYSDLKKLNPFQESCLKKSHKVMTNNIINGGEYRNNNEGVFDGGRCIFIAPPPYLVPSLMSDLFNWLINDKENLLIKALVFHYEFVFIHPFLDGNGRMARLWCKLILGKYNEKFYLLPIEKWILNSQAQYYEAIKKANASGESSEFIKYLLNVIVKNLKTSYE